MNGNTYDYDLNDIFSDESKVKYGCAKKLLAIAVENPEEMYKHFDFFVELMDNKNKILKWTAIDIIGFISFVDSENKVDSLIDNIISFINLGNVITANHSIESLINICLAKPQWTDKIVEELLKIENYKYDTPECNNIAIGKVILGFNMIIDRIKNNQQVIEFIKRNINNERNATRKKAEKTFNNIG